MVDELSLDELNRRLAQIRDELLALAVDDFAETYRLKTEQDRLRQLARRYARDRDSERSSEDLLAEVAARKVRLDEIRKIYLSSAGQAGGGGAGAGSFEGPKDAMIINAKIAEATGAEALLERIARLETILNERGDL